MDNYLDKNRFISLYYANAQKEAVTLRQTADHAGFRYLRSTLVRDSFMKNIDIFIQSQLNGISKSKNESECRECISNLRKQKEHIDNQTFSLMNGRAKIMASGQVVKKLDAWGYIINGVGVVIGGIQFAAGIGIVFSSTITGNIIGIGAGAWLIMHGANSVIEGGNNIYKNRVDTVGFMRENYIETAKFLGFDKRTGSIAYSSVDLLLSGYGLGRLVLKPDEFCLFKHIHSDFVRNYKNASAPALTIEATGDTLSIYNAATAKN